MISRFVRIISFAILMLVIAVACTAQKSPKSSSGDPFLGRWKLSSKSRFIDKNDRLTSMTRSYTRDGENVKVSWQGRTAAGKSVSGSYSARCDGTQEQASNNVQITCQKVSRRRVDGEIADPSDPGHRCFTEQVAADGQTMNLIWYKDTDRKQVREVLMFNRQQ